MRYRYRSKKIQTEAAADGKRNKEKISYYIAKCNKARQIQIEKATNRRRHRLKTQQSGNGAGRKSN